MDMIAQRTEYREDGIFSHIGRADNGLPVMVTLEHAYWSGTEWQPKIPPGFYTCVRGLHRLASMTEDFETFEITGVQGHTNLLFHAGNFNKDSEGCMLCGQEVAEGAGAEMVTNSRVTFAKFMGLQEGCTTFQLEVRG